MASQTMLDGMKFSINGTPNSHVLTQKYSGPPSFLNVYTNFSYKHQLLMGTISGREPPRVYALEVGSACMSIHLIDV